MCQFRLLPGSERAGRRKNEILSRKVDATGLKPGGSTVGKQYLLAQPEPFGLSDDNIMLKTSRLQGR